MVHPRHFGTFGSTVVLVSALMAADTSAQQGRFGLGPLDLLRNRQVREELQLVDDQIDKLREIRNRIEKEVRELFAETRKLDAEQRRARMGEVRETMRKHGERLQEELRQVLLDHQQQRLGQLQMQMQLQRRGTTSLLGSQAVREELDITDQQLEELRGLAEEVQQQLRKDIAEARKKARDKLLGVLTPEQRKQWDELLGESFTPRRENGSDDRRPRDSSN